MQANSRDAAACARRAIDLPQRTIAGDGSKCQGNSRAGEGNQF